MLDEVGLLLLDRDGAGPEGRVLVGCVLLDDAVAGLGLDRAPARGRRRRRAGRSGRGRWSSGRANGSGGTWGSFHWAGANPIVSVGTGQCPSRGERVKRRDAGTRGAPGPAIIAAMTERGQPSWTGPRPARSSRSKTTAMAARTDPTTDTAASPRRRRHRVRLPTRRRTACRARSRSARCSSSGPGARPRRRDPASRLPPRRSRPPTVQPRSGWHRAVRPRMPSRCRRPSNATHRATGPRRPRGRAVPGPPRLAPPRRRRGDPWHAAGRRRARLPDQPQAERRPGPGRQRGRSPRQRRLRGRGPLDGAGPGARRAGGRVRCRRGRLVPNARRAHRRPADRRARRGPVHVCPLGRCLVEGQAAVRQLQPFRHPDAQPARVGAGPVGAVVGAVQALRGLSADTCRGVAAGYPARRGPGRGPGPVGARAVLPAGPVRTGRGWRRLAVSFAQPGHRDGHARPDPDTRADAADVRHPGGGHAVEDRPGEWRESRGAARRERRDDRRLATGTRSETRSIIPIPVPEEVDGGSAAPAEEPTPEP